MSDYYELLAAREREEKTKAAQEIAVRAHQRQQRFDAALAAVAEIAEGPDDSQIKRIAKFLVLAFDKSSQG